MQSISGWNWVRHESELRVASQSPPTPCLVWCGWDSGLCFSTAAEHGLPGERRAGARVHHSIGNENGHQFGRTEMELERKYSVGIHRFGCLFIQPPGARKPVHRRSALVC